MSTLLEGTLILGILTALIGIFKDRTDRRLQYITNERKEWREQIRKIARKLQSESEESEINKILCELKVKINTYGIANSDNVFQDAHIWKIIKTLEDAESSDERKKAKKILIEYLSCLLKDDWERSKIEVIGTNTITLCAITNILFFVFVIFWCGLSFDIDIKSFDIDQMNDLAFAFTIVFAGCFTIINFVVFYMQIKTIIVHEDFIKKIKDRKIFGSIKDFRIYIVYAILWIIYLFVVFLIPKLFKKEMLFTITEFMIFIAVTIVYIFILFSIYCFQVGKRKKNYIIYYDTIKRIYIMEMCPSANYISAVNNYKENHCTLYDCPRKDCPKFRDR